MPNFLIAKYFQKNSERACRYEIQEKSRIFASHLISFKCQEISKKKLFILCYALSLKANMLWCPLQTHLLNAIHDTLLGGFALKQSHHLVPLEALLSFLCAVYLLKAKYN